MTSNWTGSKARLVPPPLKKKEHKKLTTLRAASHYGQRSRDCRFPPNKLQEIKNIASQSSTLEAKVQRPQLALQNTCMAVFFHQGDGLLKDFWVGHEWKPKIWSRGRRIYYFWRLVKEFQDTNILAMIRSGGHVNRVCGHSRLNITLFIFITMFYMTDNILWNIFHI